MIDYVGRQLGNYQLTRLLGEGGFAQVYLGEHIYLGTPAAIKVLNTQVAGNMDWFRAEARTIARLIHPNIVRVLEFGVEGGNTPFLVMDYAPNGTLRQRHTKGTVLPLPVVISYVQQIAEALQYAHDAKLIHRDVKPENMLLGRNNEVLLSDFGIALIAQTMLSQAALQNIAGTLPYMAPEQIQGQPRQASDQYSLGIIAYEWLVGERPFDGAFTEIISQQLAIPPPSLRAKIPMVPPAVEQVVLTALEKDPDKRFGSVREFALALERAGYFDASPLPIQTSTPTVPGQVPPTLPAYRETIIKPGPAGTVVSSYQGHSNPVRSLSWSSDGTRIVSSSNDKMVHVWEAMTGNKIQIYQDNADTVRAVAGSPDGLRIATTGSDGQIRIWDYSTNRLITSYQGHAGKEIYAMAWSPEQYLIASSASDGIVHVWNATTGQPLTIYQGHTGNVKSLAWSTTEFPSSPRPGYHIVSGGDDTSVQTWEAATGKTIAIYRGQPAKVLSVAWSPNVFASSASSDSFSIAPDSSRVACGRDDGMIQMWNTTANREALSYRYPAPVSVVAWSGNGRRFAYASEDKTIEVWDTMTNRKLLTFSHTAPPRVMVWSPDGKYIASGGDDTLIQVWIVP